MRSRVERKNLKQEASQFLKNLEALTDIQERDSKVAFLMSNSPRTSGSILLSLLSYTPANRTENIFKQIVISHVLKCEKTSAMSSSTMIKMLIELIKKSDNLTNLGAKDSEKTIRKDVEQIFVAIQEKMSRPTLKTLENYLRINFDKTTSSLVLESLKASGMSGKITFEHSNIPKPIIESNTSYIFEIEPDPNLLLQADFTLSKKDVSVLCIEGFIEKVSEIDVILSSLAERKGNAVIVCLGYSPEVVSTIIANNRRGTFNVMLCKPSQEEEAINDIFDLSAASGSCFYGFQTGTISTSFSIDHLDNINEEVVISENKISIKSSISRNSANLRAEKIREQLGESDLKDDYLKRRITSLTSSQVKINLPNKTSQEKFSQIEKIDTALRCANAITRFGIIDIPESSIIPGSGRQIASSIYIGCKYGYELFKQLSSIDTAIVLDD